MRAPTRRRGARRSQEAARDDSAATMLQGSARRRNAKQEVQQRRRSMTSSPATMLQAVLGAATQREARAVAETPASGRRRGHDAPGLGTTPQRQTGAVAGRRQARGDGVPRCSRLGRRRNAKQELSQRRRVRDDGAATMLQGCWSDKRNAKQELRERQVRCGPRCWLAATMLAASPSSGRRAARRHDDATPARRAAAQGPRRRRGTMLQGSVRRRNAKRVPSQTAPTPRRRVHVLHDDATPSSGQTARRDDARPLMARCGDATPSRSCRRRRQARDDGAERRCSSGPVRRRNATQRSCRRDARRGTTARPGCSMGSVRRRSVLPSCRGVARSRNRAATMLQGSMPTRSRKSCATAPSARRRAPTTRPSDRERPSFSPALPHRPPGDDVVKTALDDRLASVGRCRSARLRALGQRAARVAHRARAERRRRGERAERRGRTVYSVAHAAAAAVDRGGAGRRTGRAILERDSRTTLQMAPAAVFENTKRAPRDAAALRDAADPAAPATGVGAARGRWCKSGPGQEKAGVRRRDAQNGGGPGRK